MRAVKALIIGVCGLILTACASTPPSPQALAANDPYEQTNRQMLVFNGKIDRYVVAPQFRGLFLSGAGPRAARGA